MRLIPIAILALATVPAAAQTTYATATYLKYKPGKTGADHKEQVALAEKGAAAYIAAGERTGYVHLVRVFPSSHEMGHDALYFYTRSSRPVFGAPSSGTFHKAIGMTDAEWQARTRSSSDVVKQEIWQSDFAHGTIAKGDTVRVAMFNHPEGKGAEYSDFIREYIGPVQSQLVKEGAVKGAHGWTLMLTPEGAPYVRIGLRTFEKGDGPLQPLPSAEKILPQALPGKSVATYLARNRELVRAVGYVIISTASSRRSGSDCSPTYLRAHRARGGSVLGDSRRRPATEMVQLLIANGADPKAPGESGLTALHAAAFDVELTEMLLAAGADPNAATERGQTPLFGAVARKGNGPAVAALLRSGANPNALRRKAPTQPRRTKWATPRWPSRGASGNRRSSRFWKRPKRPVTAM